MDLERERGITIKLQAARMRYLSENTPYCLNSIDTPGHVDFSHEVSRSLATCEGALLVVDASQVLNKIDLPGAEPDRVVKEIEEILGLDCSNIILCSAKVEGKKRMKAIGKVDVPQEAFMAVLKLEMDVL